MVMYDSDGLKTMTFHCVADIATTEIFQFCSLIVTFDLFENIAENWKMQHMEKIRNFRF